MPQSVPRPAAADRGTRLARVIRAAHLLARRAIRVFVDPTDCNDLRVKCPQGETSSALEVSATVTYGPIRKVFGVNNGQAASTPAYWDRMWARHRECSRREPRQSGPVHRWLKDSLHPKSLVLEAGCGSGVVAAWLSQHGHHVVGLDFALSTLKGTKRQAPTLCLIGADLELLPIAPGCFDAVVSLGAVEHIPEGPATALKEHRRVLKDGGQLLISVPRLSLLKRWNDFRMLLLRPRAAYRSARGRLVTRVSETAREGAAPSSFIQYEFPRSVMVRLLGDTGFDVVCAHAGMNSAGIGESALVRRVSERRVARRTPWVAGGALASARAGGGLRGLVFGETADGVLSRALLSATRAVIGHMDFFVAEAR